jgi:hypothetical protein
MDFSPRNMFAACKVVACKTVDGEQFDVLFHPGYRQCGYPHPHVSYCGGLMHRYMEAMRAANVTDNHSAYILKIPAKMNSNNWSTGETLIGIMNSDNCQAIFSPDVLPEYEVCSSYLSVCRLVGAWCDGEGDPCPLAVGVFRWLFGSESRPVGVPERFDFYKKVVGDLLKSVGGCC